IGLARTQQLCGESHPCVPFRDIFQFNNDPVNVNATSDQGQIDIRWSHAFFGIRSQIYMSVMNEDSSPFLHSGTSHLFGVTAFLTLTPDETLRLTVEYVDSVPTADIFSFGDVLHGVAYNNFGYPDGMRYRGRTLGFSLDSDSKLLSLQAAWSDRAGRFYELSFHNAHISNPNNLVGNALTTAPVRINIGEARVSMPWNGLKLDLALRLQDDQPRPRSGFDTGFEIALRAPL
ncbi:MAG TPA: capsule assembly Wzi family protein, partial [Rhizomicrobium sp.]|nr:capsule assembly Wzi family protein [Rhizomicrobium sp.]